MCDCTKGQHDHPIYATKKYVDSKIAELSISLVPVGSIAVIPKHTTPSGWLTCNGSTFDTDQFPELFAYLGTDTLPNLQGRTVFGWKNGDNDFNSIGTEAGVKEVSLSLSEMPQHNHTVDVDTTTTNATGTSGAGRISATVPMGRVNPGTGINVTTAIRNAGGNEAHTNLPPYRVCHWVIFSGQVT